MKKRRQITVDNQQTRFSSVPYQIIIGHYSIGSKREQKKDAKNNKPDSEPEAMVELTDNV